ncbi:MAG: LamG domain-containing protein, partial [Candidatus Poribacteria bacterium]|nr:LamG domain-containing protein [Candidatus Poribacteria bacterium]
TCMLLIAVVIPVEGIDDNLLLYLTFDNDTPGVAADVTGKTKGGKLVGGTRVIPGGVHARALQLNGTNGFVEIELTDEMIEAERNSFTADFWIQTEAKGIPPPEGVERFVGLGIIGGFGPKTHFQGHWSILLLNEDILRFFVVNVNSFVNDGKDGVIAERPKINDGVWHHIAAVRDEDNKQLRLYIDGNLAGEAQDLTRSLNSKPGDDKARTKIWLGNHLEVFYSVKFDEVRLWNKALTGDEVSANMTTFAVDSHGKLALTWGGVKNSFK